MKWMSLAVAVAVIAIFGCKKEEPKAPAKAPEKVADKVADKAPAKAPEKAADKAAEAPKPAAPVDGAAALQAGMKAWSEGKADEALAAYADDVEWVDQGMNMPPAKGKAGVKERWGFVRTGMPDAKLAATRILDGGNVVVVQAVITGTHTAPFMGVAATGKKVGWDCAMVFFVDGGKVKKAYSYANPMTFLAQVGDGKDGPAPAVPEAPATPEIVKAAAVPANLEIAKKVRDDLNNADAAAAAAALDKDLSKEIVGTFHGANKVVKGAEAFKGWIASFRKAFPDAKLTVGEQWSIGPYVVSAYTKTGTHKGDLGPMKATNKTLNVHGLDIIKVDANVAAAYDRYTSAMEMRVQLGLMQPPAPAAAGPAKAEAGKPDAPKADAPKAPEKK